jgi:hypothetical protein
LRGQPRRPGPIRGTVSKAKFDLSAIRRDVFDAIKGLDAMQHSLSSTAGK